jgi:hypothetical protein
VMCLSNLNHLILVLKIQKIKSLISLGFEASMYAYSFWVAKPP